MLQSQIQGQRRNPYDHDDVVQYVKLEAQLVIIDSEVSFLTNIHPPYSVECLDAANQQATRGRCMNVYNQYIKSRANHLIDCHK
jgi:hypothetical protein